MKNLDNFYNKKLQNREFEFKDSYWEEAEQMIVADEKSRRTGWYFWFFGLLVLIVAGSLFLLTESAKKQQNVEAHVNLENDFEQSSAIAEKDHPSFDNSKDNATFSSLNANPTIEKTNPAIQENQQKNTLQNKKSTVFPEQEIENNSGVNLSEMDSKVDKTDVVAAENDLIEGLEKSKNKNKTIPKDEFIDNENRIEELASDKEIKNTASLLPINTNWDYLDQPEYLKLEKIGVPGEKSFAFGLTASGMIYPAGNGEKNWIGVSGGFLAKYRFSKRMTLNAEVLYTFRTGTFDVVSTTTQTQFGFGKQTITYLSRPESLHFIEVPIYAQITFGRHGIEAGGMLSYLAGIRGGIEKQTSLYPWERTDENDFETENYASGWIVKDAFNTLNGSALIGYKYQLNHGFSLGLRGVYRFGALGQEAAQELIKEDGSLYFNLSATWFFSK